MRVIVAGMVAGTPNQGGAAWAVLQYVLGLRRLGHDVFLIEPVSEAQPGGSCNMEIGDSLRYLEHVAASFGLQGRCALIAPGSGATAGLTLGQVQSAFETADLVLNFSGILRDVDLLQKVPARVYVDLDPGFTQLWQDVQGIDMGFGGHTHFVTVGPSIGTKGCPIPACGIDWIGTPQPVALEYWPTATEITHDAFTTIANWRGYGSVEYQGAFHGQKAHSLREFIDAPVRTGERFELALSIHPGEVTDLAALDANGWSRLDPVDVAGTPRAYRDFIAGSRSEFGIAKSGYVKGATGWFSDRSVCYLASGRPVLAQETGFSNIVPAGEGLLAFENMDDVVAGTEALRRDYPRHARAARQLAEAYFDSDRVLTHLLDRIGS